MSFTPDYAGFKTLLLALALPPAPMLLLAAWAGWRLHRRRRGGAALLALALVSAWLACTEGGAELLARAAGSPTPLSLSQVEALRGQAGGAVLVLGGGVNRWVPERQAGGLKTATAERLAHGVWLARRSGWPLAFSGGIGWQATELRQSEAEIVARVAAQDYQLPLRWAEGRSRDTRENAANTLPLLAAAGVTQVLLVTHDMHMPRSLRAFEAAAAPLGLRITPAPLGLRDDALSSVDDWLPSASGFARVRYFVYEQLAWWAGR
jgi:uncharacterized SAM-binding protein YcdF (DUF218 family)